MARRRAGGTATSCDAVNNSLRLMDKILHDPKDPKLWELWYIPYYGSCRILSINRRITRVGFRGIQTFRRKRVQVWRLALEFTASGPQGFRAGVGFRVKVVGFVVLARASVNLFVESLQCSKKHSA